MSTSDLSQKSNQTRRAGEFGHGPGRQNVRNPSGRSSSSTSPRWASLASRCAARSLGCRPRRPLPPPLANANRRRRSRPPPSLPLAGLGSPEPSTREGEGGARERERRKIEEHAVVEDLFCRSGEGEKAWGLGRETRARLAKRRRRGDWSRSPAARSSAVQAAAAAGIREHEAEQRRREQAREWRREHARDWGGERAGIGLGFPPRARVLCRCGRRKKGVRRGENVSPTDLWTTGPIVHGLLRRYCSPKQVKKVLTASNGHK